MANLRDFADRFADVSGGIFDIKRIPLAQAPESRTDQNTERVRPIVFCSAWITFSRGGSLAPTAHSSS
jgi:hypothetical protein